MKTRTLYTLGDSNTRITLHNHDDYSHHIVSLTNQSKHCIQIFTCDFPSVIFADNEFNATISGFLRTRRHSQVEILLKDTDCLTKRHSELVPLNYRLSSLKIRKADEDYCFGEQTILLFDKTGIVLKPEINSQAGTACYNDKANGRTLSQKFSGHWERASVDPNLRELLI